MIIIKNREMLIPEHERYLGTTYDNLSENRVFLIPRFSQNGTDLSALNFRLDFLYASGSHQYDTITLVKTVNDEYITLTWPIREEILQVPGTVIVQIRAIDTENTVKWSTFQAAFYVERHLNTPGNYSGSLTEIRQMESDHEYMKGVINELKASLDYTSDAEAWAVGTRKHVDEETGAVTHPAVTEGDETYHNNSKYHAEMALYRANNAGASATAAAESATQAAATVVDTNARFNNAVAAVTVDTEVIDARVGADGTTYPVLKNRLDAEHDGIKSTIQKNTGAEEVEGWEIGKRIKNNGDTVDFNPVSTTVQYACIVADCTGGEKFTLSAYGANTSYRVVCWCLNDGTVVARCANGTTCVDDIIEAPATAQKLVVNTQYTSESKYYLFRGITSAAAEKALAQKENLLSDAVGKITGNVIKATGENAYIDLSGSTADVTAPVYSLGSKYAVVPCTSGDAFTITTRGGASGRAYGFIDGEGNILAVAPEATYYDNYTLIAPADAEKLIVNSYLSTMLIYSGSPICKTVENMGFAVFGGTVRYENEEVAAMPSSYDGWQFKIKIGETLATTRRLHLDIIRNRIIDIPQSAHSVMFRAYHTDANYGSLFLNANGVIVNGYANSGVSGTVVTVRIPEDAVRFVYSYPTSFEDYSVVFYGDGIKPQMPSVPPIGLHTMPESIGVLNAIKRARQITDIKWTPDMNIPRTSLLWGGSEHQYFEDSFTAGKEYEGIPYGDFLGNYDQVIGLSRPIDVFATSVCNPDTAVGRESEYGKYHACYYGCACTGLTAYALGLPYTYSTYYGNIEGMVTLFKLIENGVRHSLETIKLGDVVQMNGHCALITDIIYADDGNVEYIEISEESRDGNANKDVIGGQYGGKARRFTMTQDEFFTYYADFYIMRYAYIDSVTYKASPYVPMPDEGNRIRLLNLPVLPYYGNKCMLDGNSVCKLLISSTGYTHLIVKKNGIEWNEDGTANPYSISGRDEINITCDPDEAVYTAFLATYKDGTIRYKTDSCEWYVKGTIEVTASVTGSNVDFTVRMARAELLPWFVNIKRTDTLRGYNHLIFDDYEVTYSSGYYTYTFSVPFTGDAPASFIMGVRSDNYGAAYIAGTI